MELQRLSEVLDRGEGDELPVTAISDHPLLLVLQQCLVSCYIQRRRDYYLDAVLEEIIGHVMLLLVTAVNASFRLVMMFR